MTTSILVITLLTACSVNEKLRDKGEIPAEIRASQEGDSKVIDQIIENSNSYEEPEPVDFIDAQALKMWDENIESIGKAIEDFNDRDQIEAVLMRYLEVYEQAQIIYLASPKGDFYISQVIDLPAEYDPTTRPWYLNAVEAGEIYESESYVDAFNEKNIITVSKELKNAPKSGWVLGIDIVEN